MATGKHIIRVGATRTEYEDRFERIGDTIEVRAYRDNQAVTSAITIELDREKLSDAVALGYDRTEMLKAMLESAIGYLPSMILGDDK